LSHLPPDRISAERTLPSATHDARAYVEEALRWLPEERVASGQWPVTGDSATATQSAEKDKEVMGEKSARILLADDNADMREYIKRILGEHWIVEAVSDGKSALEVARERAPDLVISDVMMPGLDGFELLRELRADPRTRRAPIILLSARAGEESRIEGLEAGADDYLVKPFSARELIARVGSHINIARIRGEAQEQVRHSQERLQLTSDTVPALISYIDTERRYQFCNRTYLEWFGLTFEDIIGKYIWDVLGAEAWEAIRPYMDAAFEGQTADFETEANYKLGGARWIHAVYTPHLGADGRVIGVVILVSDITARRKAEEDRERLLTAERVAREAADAASRAKDEFLATVSHELRTPLNAMLGWARLLSSGTLNDETAKRGLKSIEQNAKAQAQLVEDLLDVSRIISGKLRLNTEPVQVSRVIEAALDSVRPTAEAKGVTLQVSLDPDAGPVAGDAGRLQQVVWNLLSNAVKFTSKEGRVQVSLRRVDSQVEILVKDTGQGIDSEFLPYVFDRFRQADGTPTRAHGGLGLGLAIVRHITELHGGSVSVDSPGRGQGATCSVRIPLMALHERLDGDEHSRARLRGGVDLSFQPSLVLEGVKVLIVDDEPQTLLLLSTVLTECGAYVKTASSAEEGFRLVQSWGPGVIVSDIGMPDEDGYEFIKRVRKWAREAGAWIPAVALTAFARAEDRMKSLASGYQIHVPKPVEPAELIAVIRSLVERPTTPWNTAS
ncbi:MAG TPA: response regulator, partial [Blastocatellia bacterium]|nr:response regulator [Blastocatellia bacterium]